MNRWTATITYRCDEGLAHIFHDLDEIEELDGIVEQGPHWDTIDQITIVRTGGNPTLTVEKAAQL